MSAPVLWHFRFSHFNEKVRWALDWKGIPHVRRALLPGLHLPRILWMTGQKLVPVLVVDGKAIADSTRIIETLEELRPDPPLFPADAAERRRAAELEDYFDAELGPHVRRWVFHEVLPDTAYSARLLATGFGSATALVYRALFPGIRAVMRADMGIDGDGAARSRARADAAIDRLEREIGQAGHLVADRFSVADLTAAALLSPLVLPPEFPYRQPASAPVAVQRIRDEYRRRPAWRWVEETYRRFRGASAAREDS